MGDDPRRSLSDDQINAIVARLAQTIVRECRENPMDILSASFGLVGHSVVCFGISNEDAHQLLASLLAQRDGAHAG